MMSFKILPQVWTSLCSVEVLASRTSTGPIDGTSTISSLCPATLNTLCIYAFELGRNMDLGFDMSDTECTDCARLNINTLQSRFLNAVLSEYTRCDITGVPLYRIKSLSYDLSSSDGPLALMQRVPFVTLNQYQTYIFARNVSLNIVHARVLNTLLCLRCMCVVWACHQIISALVSTVVETSACSSLNKAQNTGEY